MAEQEEQLQHQQQQQQQNQQTSQSVPIYSIVTRSSQAKNQDEEKQNPTIPVNLSQEKLKKKVNEQREVEDEDNNSDESDDEEKYKPALADMTEFYYRCDDSYKNLEEKAIQVWIPAESLTDEQIEEYINKAANTYSYNIEQALAILNWHKHDLNKAYTDMQYFIPKPVEWTQEEKILFDQAFIYHGKNFNKIRQVLPDKSQASLVTYYYMWKKNRNHTSLLDQHQTNTKNSNNNEASNGINGNIGINGNGINGNNVIDNDLSDTANSGSDDGDSLDDDNYNEKVKMICCNCDLITNDLQSTPKGMLCSPCYSYWKNTNGLMRPDHLSNKSQYGIYNHLQNKTNRYLQNNAQFGNSSANTAETAYSRDAKNFHKSLRKPPKGIYLNYDELLNLAENDNEKIFEALNRQILFLKKQNQYNKMEINDLIVRMKNGQDNIQDEVMKVLSHVELKQYTSNWNLDEICLAIQSFSTYGDDFEAISQLIGTKNEASVKAFYYYHKDNYNLDKLILNSSKDITAKATLILNDLTKQNRSDIPIEPINFKNFPVASNNDAKSSNMDADDIIYIPSFK